jgi:biofilm PGA synthesis N-glycosyltransferase PgaC
VNCSSYVVISPVRNEEEYLYVTISSLVAQTIRPTSWILVNDGSSDNTGRIADEAAQRHEWIQVIHRSDRGFRQSGVGVVEAFYDGFARVQSRPWHYIVKLDGDVRLPPCYFELLMKEFERDEQLGICSGDVFNEEEGGLVLDSPNDPVFHVRGAAKIYRRACWDAIGGIPQVTGFDCVDNVKARMLGWHTRRFSSLEVIHLRKTGVANGIWRNSFKDGSGANAIGYHPLFLFLKCFKRAIGGSPIGGLGQLCGFVKAYFGKIPRIQDRQLVQYLRRQQLNRLLGKESIWR